MPENEMKFVQILAGLTELQQAQALGYARGLADAARIDQQEKPEKSA